MKKLTFLFLLATLAFSTAPVYSQQNATKTNVKPELRNAITVTPEMLAPMRLAPGEYWFSALINDPRSGEFKGGYLTYKFFADNRGLQVISANNVITAKVYNMTAAKSISSNEETFSPAYGRIIRQHYEGDLAVMMSLSAPKSSVRVNKIAAFDWENKTITINYGNDPKAPVRVKPLEENTTSGMAMLAFMLKAKWTDTSKIYRFHYFNIGQEQYEDVYIKCLGMRDKNTIKYQTVWHGYGEGGQLIFWVTLPKAGAPTGMFQKYIVDPMTSRYTTYQFTTKKEALKPVRPLID
ncbi:MAG: hypothetical protein WCX65_13250 [bacterium]